MTLRCKPGDLAVVIGGDEPALIGRIFRIVSRCPVIPNCWDTDPPAYVSWDPRPASLQDHTLRPIRDPGEDARDETLDWLPSHSQLTALV